MSINRRQFLRAAPTTAGLAALTLPGRAALAADVPASVARVPKLVPSDGGRVIWWMGDDRFRFQALTPDTGGAYTWWIDEPPANVGPPRHVHSREEEGFYVLDGEIVFQAGTLKATAGPGTFLALPAGIPHGWLNGKTPARLITFTAPAGNEGFFLELGEEKKGPRQVKPIAEINRRSERYGVTYFGPTDDPAEGALALGDGRTATSVNPGEGEKLYAAGVEYAIKASGRQTAGAYTLTELTLDPGGVIPGLRHPRYEEGIYVLEGEVAATIAGRAFDAGPGDFLVVPWGLTHAIKNASGKPARLLSLTTPAGIEDYFRAACRKAGPDAKDDLDRLRTIGRRYGVFS
jgi:quercetin dioxygenase-like cupin family protein